MDKNELKKLREDLVKEKATVEEALMSTARKNPIVKDYYEQPRVEDIGSSPDDTALEAVDFDRMMALKNTQEQRLHEINETLAQIDSGEYGICVNCASGIGAARLKVIPAATLCISCAQKTGR
ncbi:MAG: hypothetical protein A3B17_02925 [Candidatus Yanofskybacteria bacterium RIFCSPLOWO2_01_FULL_45_72]|nr:MAG: hypothetical protein A3B17_02925 [Candidatus Yanofskybacteria bacterium RIFCSPLOWO2_01_FULL_45_72]